ncbi:hypothetical protein [Streptomyces diastatochromogenes]|uniref:Uncharacterized protein n=1 Tax=Streptomyces diastatochromogenes TaxID=42236 RepID=A0A233SCU2_STRDA|nr:hypothetical protein [Streptomyces diastatochromogenes]MCZ0990344.1 hypothetical protein [Streptomyces diastatochromogenes]OXY93470.1 hypothetical protein BEK98_22445 [Streptomyces diastatochromogenes]
MDPGTHFAFGTHPQHGFVAAFTATMPAHLAHWFLTREQFEPVPERPGLFRLTQPDRDGPRRTRQAVHDLRAQGYAVHADVGLDPDAPATAPRPFRPRALSDRRTRLAQAASVRSPQHRTAPTTSPPAARPIPPKPAFAPTVHLSAERSR